MSSCAITGWVMGSLGSKVKLAGSLEVALPGVRFLRTEGFGFSDAGLADRGDLAAVLDDFLVVAMAVSPCEQMLCRSGGMGNGFLMPIPR